MENASKALLIAGAILIAILLIAIGMMVFNSASGVIDTASSGMSDHEKTLHNKKFTIYEGKQKGSVVKDLVEVVKTHNANTDNTPVTIVDSDGKDLTVYTQLTKINNATQYTVDCPLDQGLVKKITVK